MAINDQSYDANYGKLFKDKRKSKKLIYEKTQAMSMEVILPPSEAAVRRFTIKKILWKFFCIFAQHLQGTATTPSSVQMQR